MIALAHRQEAERQFHDAQAQERATTFANAPERLGVDDETYLSHAGWIRPAFHFLGDVTAKDVLDYGCGHGSAGILLARRGARVKAFDLSPGYVRETLIRAQYNDVMVDAIVACAEALPYPDASFDVVWGNAILHHTDLDIALPELHRVLRPGGRAVFCEPWGGNPLLEFVRRRIPYPDKGRTRDERPLMPGDLRTVCRHFPTVRTTGYELMTALGRWHPIFRRLQVIDRCVFTTIPRTQKWARYLVIELRRD